MKSLKIPTNIEEISRSQALRLFGVALALLHLASFFFWRESFLDRMRNPLDFLCWPFFPACGVTRSLPFEFWRIFFVLYGLLSLVTAAFFWARRVPAAWWCLFGLTLVKWLFQILDYRGMGNYHLMFSLVSIVYLFLPDKISSLRFLVILFYLASGIQKFNVEWLSGALLENSLLIRSQVVLWLGTSAVLFLEMIVVWFLLAKSTWLRWGALLSFVGFHLISSVWVGFYFPTVMIGILLIYPLTWRESPPSGILEKNNTPKAWPSRAFLLFFSILQILPFFVSAGGGLDARSRFLSLNMYDLRPQCEQRIYLRYLDHIVEYVPFFSPVIKLQCNTVSFRSEMSRICSEESLRPDFVGVDAVMVSKRLTDDFYQGLVSEQDFCARRGQK